MGVSIEFRINIEREDLESILDTVNFNGLVPKVDVGPNLTKFLKEGGDLPPNLKKMMDEGMKEFFTNKMKSGKDDDEDLK